MDRETKSYESEDGSPRKGNDPSNSAEDQALVNLITQTAKKSSYNNSKKDLTVKAEAPPPPPPKRRAAAAVWATSRSHQHRKTRNGAC